VLLPLPPLPIQALLLSAGRMLYFGPCSGVVPWFSGRLGYAWQPSRHGNPADWAMDLINVAFEQKAGGGAADEVGGDRVAHDR
jgi:hypothetical protein